MSLLYPVFLVILKKVKRNEDSILDKRDVEKVKSNKMAPLFRYVTLRVIALQA